EPFASGEARICNGFLCKVTELGADHHHTQRSRDVAARAAENAFDVFFLLCVQLVPVIRRFDAIASQARNSLTQLVDSRRRRLRRGEQSDHQSTRNARTNQDPFHGCVSWQSIIALRDIEWRSISNRLELTIKVRFESKPDQVVIMKYVE